MCSAINSSAWAFCNSPASARQSCQKISIFMSPPDTHTHSRILSQLQFFCLPTASCIFITAVVSALHILLGGGCAAAKCVLCPWWCLWLCRPHIPHFPFPIPCPCAHQEQRVPHSFAAFEICQGAATNLCDEKSMNSCTRRKALLNFNLKRLKLALQDSLNLVGSLHRNVVSL